MTNLEYSQNLIANNLTKDLENWMTKLPPKLRSIPIIHLAIPGSHDSATYGITEHSGVAPDAESIIRKLQFLGPILKTAMVRWTVTQSETITDQLTYGIRYFDLRIATRAIDKQFYIVHGLYAERVQKVMEELMDFLDAHPNEVVILDCQHFYAFQQSDHETFMHILTAIFGGKLLPYMQHMNHISLDYMTNRFHQVILIYRSDAARFGQPQFWPSASFPTPWPQTVSISKLMNFLDGWLEKRNHSVGFVSQCVLTPDSCFVTKHVFSSLTNKCVLPLEEPKYRWLRRQRPGERGINIVISDYINFNEGAFPREVINLNMKLLDIAYGTEMSSPLTPIDNSY